MPARTVLVYMVADNNLDPFALKDINEMEQGWSDDFDGTLIAYIDRAEGAQPAHPVVYKIAHDEIDSLITSPIVDVYPEQNSADTRVMAQVLADIFSRYPADAYGLVLWSHGTGWLPPGASFSGSKGPVQPLAFGRDNGQEMNIPAMANALPIHFDFIIFDACYMGSIEVAYELADKADYILASPTEVLSAGYPYREVVPMLFAPQVNYANMAATFFQSYTTLNSASISVVKTSELGKVAVAFRSIMNDTTQLHEAVSDSLQQFSIANGLLVDASHFVAQITTVEHAAHFDTALVQAIVYKACTDSFLNTLNLAHFCGLSIFAPDTSNISYHEFYKTFRWYRDCGYSRYFGKLSF